MAGLRERMEPFNGGEEVALRREVLPDPPPFSGQEMEVKVRHRRRRQWRKAENQHVEACEKKARIREDPEARRKESPEEPWRGEGSPTSRRSQRPAQSSAARHQLFHASVGFSVQTHSQAASTASASNLGDGGRSMGSRNPPPALRCAGGRRRSSFPFKGPGGGRAL